jgi:hypothetical protein
MEDTMTRSDMNNQEQTAIFNARTTLHKVRSMIDVSLIKTGPRAIARWETMADEIEETLGQLRTAFSNDIPMDHDD